GVGVVAPPIVVAPARQAARSQDGAAAQDATRARAVPVGRAPRRRGDGSPRIAGGAARRASPRRRRLDSVRPGWLWELPGSLKLPPGWHRSTGAGFGKRELATVIVGADEPPRTARRSHAPVIADLDDDGRTIIDKDARHT